MEAFQVCDNLFYFYFPTHPTTTDAAPLFCLGMQHRFSKCGGTCEGAALDAISAQGLSRPSPAIEAAAHACFTRCAEVQRTYIEPMMERVRRALRE